MMVESDLESPDARRRFGMRVMRSARVVPTEPRITRNTPPPQ